MQMKPSHVLLLAALFTHSAGGGLLNAEEHQSVGLIPLTDMGAADEYKGESGGLYGGGRNAPPARLLNAARAAAQKVVPRNASGDVDANGLIGFIAVGMSNTTQEFSRFVSLCSQDAEVARHLRLVDYAQGGKDARRWADGVTQPDGSSNPWTVAAERLQASSLTESQVQVAWIKQALAGPAKLGEFPLHSRALKDDLASIVNELKARFPNLRLVYLSNRIYAGYATTKLNPEPYAYESAFANRWLILDQRQKFRDRDEGAPEEIRPLLLWGPYLWADGEAGRKSDRLVWNREDLAKDGTHPSDSGRQKVAFELLRFFKSDPTTKWFVKSSTTSHAVNSPPVDSEQLAAREFDPPPRADADEPLASELSLSAAAKYLDAAALEWTRTRKCATCHTNVPYLMARPLLSNLYPEPTEVRSKFEQWSDNWDEQVPRGGQIPASAIALGATLAINDSLTSGKLHASTRRALARMWEMQREDGGWDWRVNDAPPMKSDEHYGVTFAAVAVGTLPAEYTQTAEARRGISRMRKYLKEHPPHSLHHRAMIGWASLGLEGLMSAGERRHVIDRMLDLQREDGGWSADSLFADWEDWDLDDNDLESDGYGTGFVIYLARRIGVPASDRRLQRGIEWIKTHQRESGRWFTASIGPDNPYGDNRISTAGTAMVVMALDACREIQ
jgi:squalene-hopene/tetraprenyl-beta-curcumene cyclase